MDHVEPAQAAVGGVVAEIALLARSSPPLHVRDDPDARPPRHARVDDTLSASRDIIKEIVGRTIHADGGRCRPAQPEGIRTRAAFLYLALDERIRHFLMKLVLSGIHARTVVAHEVRVVVVGVPLALLPDLHAVEPRPARVIVAVVVVAGEEIDVRVEVVRRSFRRRVVNHLFAGDEVRDDHRLIPGLQNGDHMVARIGLDGVRLDFQKLAVSEAEMAVVQMQQVEPSRIGTVIPCVENGMVLIDDGKLDLKLGLRAALGVHARIDVLVHVTARVGCVAHPVDVRVRRRRRRRQARRHHPADKMPPADLHHLVPSIVRRQDGGSP